MSAPFRKTRLPAQVTVRRACPLQIQQPVKSAEQRRAAAVAALAKGKLMDAQEALKARGIKYGSREKIEKLEEMLAGSKRGLLAYGNCSVKELRVLCAQRGIEVKDVRHRSKTEKSELARRLEEADNDPRFERFLDLPPELRNRVYEMVLVHRVDTEDEDAVAIRINPLKRERVYISRDEPLGCDSWQEALRTMALAQTNSQIRGEALPIFYSVNTWVLDLETTYSDHCQEPSMKLWFHDIVELQNISAIKRLNLAVGNYKRTRPYRVEACTMRLQVCLGSTNVVINHEFEGIWYREQWGCRECMEKGIAIENVKNVCLNAKHRDDGMMKLNRKMLDGLLALCMKTDW